LLPPFSGLHPEDGDVKTQKTKTWNQQSGYLHHSII